MVLPGSVPCTRTVVQVLRVTALQRSASQVQYCFLCARIYKEPRLESKAPPSPALLQQQPGQAPGRLAEPGTQSARGYCTATVEAPWMDSITAAKRLHRS